MKTKMLLVAAWMVTVGGGIYATSVVASQRGYGAEVEYSK